MPVAAPALLLGVPAHLLSPRVSFQATVLLVTQLTVIWLRRPPSPAADRVATALVGALFLLTVLIVQRHLSELARIDRAWADALAAQRAAGVRAASLPVMPQQGRVTLARRDRLFLGIKPGTGDWKNGCLARATGCDSINGI